MKEFWNTIQLVFAAVGGWLVYFLGGCDGLLIALVIFVTCDYLTGIMYAIADKKLSSEVGFKGICRKVLIFLLVGIGNVIDVQVLGHPGVLRTAIIFSYLSNEGLSLTENAAHLGLPVPEKLKEVLEQPTTVTMRRNNMTRKGIGVSHWQGTIDWNKVKKAGIEFAIIKAGGSDAGFYTDSK